MRGWTENPGLWWTWACSGMSARVDGGPYGAHGFVISWGEPSRCRSVPTVPTVEQAQRIAQAIIFDLRGLHVGRMEPARTVHERGD